MKKCSACKDVKLLSLFSKNKNICKLCTSTYYRDYQEKNKVKLQDKDKAYYSNNRDKVHDRHKAYYEVNKDTIKTKSKLYRSSGNRKKISKSKSRAKWAKYKASKLNAIPVWGNNKAIKSLYALSSFLTLSTFGNGYHVDHIVPLNNDLVCGLHCEDNLQILRAEHNLSKSNQFWPDMW
jgi:hypothetical protein